MQLFTEFEQAAFKIKCSPKLASIMKYFIKVFSSELFHEMDNEMSWLDILQKTN